MQDKTLQSGSSKYLPALIFAGHKSETEPCKFEFMNGLMQDRTPKSTSPIACRQKG